MSERSQKEQIILAAGCFWGVQHIIDEVEGVVSTAVGYTSGHTENPTYEDVCTGTTGHTEAVFVEFDPQKVSLSDLLGFFWRLHDPTQLNRQGPDRGTQYRSGIYYFTDDQGAIAKASKSRFENERVFAAPIVTEILPAQTFYPAEDYHQKYFAKNPTRQVCHVLRPR